MISSTLLPVTYNNLWWPPAVDALISSNIMASASSFNWFELILCLAGFEFYETTAQQTVINLRYKGEKVQIGDENGT